MQSKDLRIGNYIQNINSKKIERVASINDLGHVKFRETESGMKVVVFANINEYEYISINEEWLFNFGFEFKDLVMSQTKWLVKEQKNQWRKEFRIGKYTHSKHWSFTMECVSPPTLSLIDLNYVHELQNLYFALTGEELELKSESKP